MAHLMHSPWLSARAGLRPAWPGRRGWRATSAVMSMPTGHQVMHRPQPTQPLDRRTGPRRAQLVAQPVPIAARMVAVRPGGGVGELVGEAGFPLARPRGRPLPVEVGRVADGGAEAGGADHRAIAAGQAALGHVVPVRDARCCPSRILGRPSVSIFRPMCSAAAPGAARPVPVRPATARATASLRINSRAARRAGRARTRPQLGQRQVETARWPPGRCPWRRRSSSRPGACS